MLNEDQSSNVKVIVNPYNFNNKLISEKEVLEILSKYEIEAKINGLDIYQRAFVHKSYSKKLPEEIGDDIEIASKPEGALELMEHDYERLEFLGDAVVSVVVARYLCERYPNENEGFLTKMRTKLVNGEMLAFLAEKLGFGEYVIISRHIEDKCNGRKSIHILEDIFEAFVGAMFLDFNETDNYNLLDNFYSGIGFQICEKFIINVLEDIIDFSELILKNTNYKEQLNAYFMTEFDAKIEFSEAIIEGGLVDRVFKISVLKDGKSFSDGIGKSKKKAEQNACKNGLISLGII